MDQLKKLCNMFRNQEFKHTPQKYLQMVKYSINYENPEIFKGPIKTDIINKSYANGHLQMKVFKIQSPKKSGGQGSEGDSESGVRGNA